MISLVGTRAGESGKGESEKAVKKIVACFHRLTGLPAPRLGAGHRFNTSPVLRLAIPKLVWILLATAVLAGSTPLLAATYGPATVKRMTDVTLRLAPPSLRAVLLANRDQLERGVSEALESQGSTPPEELLAEAQKEFAGIPGLPSGQVPLPVLAYHFGRLAGLVFAANDPLARGDDRRAFEVREDYFRYVERKLPLMVFSFDGYDAPPLKGNLKAYLAERQGREARYREGVLFCYFPSGTRVASETFDDRSNAFGVAQVILSHAVSDAAKAWLQVWQAMDGDLSATPYYRPAGKAGEGDAVH